MNKDKPRQALKSWKAIARYFGCSERTVRRWEAQENLPVHRHQHLAGSRVLAYPQELEQWLATRNRASNLVESSVVAITQPTIAIFPFAVLSDSDNLLWLRDAICEEVLSDLASLQAYTTISYSSMRFLPQQSEALQKTITHIGLTIYLEGSLRCQDEHVLLMVRLVDAKTQSIIWGERFNVPLGSTYLLKEQLIAGLMSQLAKGDARLNGELKSADSLSDQTVWEFVYQARAESLKWQPDAIYRAIELLNSALHLAGDSGIVLANLGRAYLQLREAGIDSSEEPLNKAQNILERLRATQPNASYTYLLAGWHAYLQGDLPNAIKTLRLLLRKQTNDPDGLGLIANCYLVVGQPELARPYIQRLQIIDPLTPLSRCLPGWYHLIRGEFEQAKGPYEKMLEMEPDSAIARMFLIWICALNNEEDELVALAQHFPDAASAALPRLISHAFALQHSEAAEKSTFYVPEELTRVAENSEMFARFLAFAYAYNKDVDNAVHWLQAAARMGFCAYPFLRDFAPFFRENLDHTKVRDVMCLIKEQWQNYQMALRFDA